MKEDFLDIRDGIKGGRYVNEATVSQGIVQRLLHTLGWPVYDTEVVAPEYSLGGRRVYYALCHPPREPVGELTAGMLDQIAKFYRAMFAAKSVENKRKKAREGKASGSGTSPFGFRYSADRRSLEVDETRMVVVRRMFSMVAEGATLHSVKKTFEREGVPTPGGGKYWYPVSMARMIRNDAYLPIPSTNSAPSGWTKACWPALDAHSKLPTASGGMDKTA